MLIIMCCSLRDIPHVIRFDELCFLCCAQCSSYIHSTRETGIKIVGKGSKSASEHFLFSLWASHPLSGSLSWNHSSTFWNWLHRGFGAACVGDGFKANGQHQSYQLSWLKSPGKRFIRRVAVLERTQHFPSSTCLLYITWFVKFKLLSYFFAQHLQWQRPSETCSLTVMTVVKSKWFKKSAYNCCLAKLII